MNKNRIENIIYAIDGSDYGQGVLEDVATTVDNVRTVIANLLDFLENKGLITEDDIENKIMIGLRGSSPRYERGRTEIEE